MERRSSRRHGLRKPSWRPRVQTQAPPARFLRHSSQNVAVVGLVIRSS
jgi:hypothetical protein